MVVEDKNIQAASFLTKSGTDITKYQESLAVSASISNSIGFKGASFSTEVGTNFTKEKYENTENAFATISSRIVKRGFYVEDRRNPAKLTSYVSYRFLNDLNSLTPEQIITNYGTHVMLGSVMGGKA